jgi:CheY-like chemotaxis protein
MPDSEEAVDRWLTAESHKLIEITAFNPVNGRSAKLDAEALLEVLHAVAAYERAPDDPKSSDRIHELGLDPSWYEREGKRTRPLFMAKGKDWEIVGYSLKDLLAAARHAAAKALEKKEGGPAKAAAAPKSDRARDRLVYIVDDDDSIRDLFSFALTREGFRLDLFTNGAEVLQHLRNTLPDVVPDLILLDMMMPVMNGFDVVKALQAHEFPKIPIIIITGRHMDTSAADALRTEPNVVEFLAKPVSPKIIALTMHDFLKTKPSKANG